MSHPIEALQRWLCDRLGHRWTYYVIDFPNHKDVRVCRRCHRLHYWRAAYLPSKVTTMIWAGGVQYREKGAREHVPGYGKEQSMTREEFKTRWESGADGGGITSDDVAYCAKIWGLYTFPKTKPMADVIYAVLKHAGCSDAEEFNPLNKEILK